jgi:hypothetical protein
MYAAKMEEQGIHWKKTMPMGKVEERYPRWKRSSDVVATGILAMALGD